MYLRYGVHGVEVISGQISNRMILGELGEAPNLPVNVFFLYQLFGDASRVLQARIAPDLGKAMLQGLNSTLYKERHEWNTRQSTSLASFQSLNTREKRKNLLNFRIRGKRIPRRQFLHFLGGIERG
jgi:hypothetical protein